jgi:hypothetical protein
MSCNTRMRPLHRTHGPLETQLTFQHRRALNTELTSTCSRLAPHPRLSRTLRQTDMLRDTKISESLHSDTSYVSQITQHASKRTLRSSSTLTNATVPQPHHNLLVYIHLHSSSDHYPGNAPLQPNFRDEGALFCALGWYVTRNETLRQFCKARTDVKLGTPQHVDLIYTLGGLYYHADMIKPLAGC